MAQQKLILIVEDNPINLKLISDVLIANSYEILQATSGKETFKVLEEKGPEIGLILLDLNLPDISGLEILKKIKNIPVIVVSAHAMEADIKASKQAGCVDYVTKPINIQEFLTKVKAVL